MIITKKHLPRRTFLRGLGVSLALPLLDGMVPALTALGTTAAKPIKRLGCVYANTLCWRAPTTPLSMANDPRVVFERLFGTSGSTDPRAWLEARKEDRSLLDGVTAKISRLQRELGPRDRTKLDEYVDSVRD